MPFTNAQLDADLSAMFADLPITVTFGAQSATCTRSTYGARLGGGTSREDVMEDEGLRDEYRFSVYLRAADFSPLPSAGDTVVIATVTYRVLLREDDSAARVTRLDLGEEYAVT